MSTNLTTIPATPVIEVPIGQLLVRAQQWTFQQLLALMSKKGHKELTIAHLMFIANLDCGVTHAALVSRRMGVTRQAVFRTTRELQALDVLKLENDPKLRNQKIISMTPLGNQVAMDARACMAEIESKMASQIGSSNFELLKSILLTEWPIGT
jgi:DNA-binding MarR family transcriptional regulator